MTAIPQQRLLAATVHVLVLYMSLLLVVGVTENQGGQDGRGMIENLEMSEGSAMEKTDENGWERKGKVADEEEVNFSESCLLYRMHSNSPIVINNYSVSVP